MVSINTNLSSLTALNSLNQSTNALNTAIERLTTGYKINHASDNAANYSIASDYSAKLSSYQVAQENVASGIDLLTTAQDTISLMQDHGSRIHALITQANNGTYGAQSLDAINQEIGARMSEISRLYLSTEYNGINLFNGFNMPDWAIDVTNLAGANAGTTTKAVETGFMDSIVEIAPDIVVEEASALEDAINNNSIIGIANADVLAELAKIVNGTDGYEGNTCSNKTITLTNDIDLSAYQDGTGWTPIGSSTKHFSGNFDGQGHKITNLKINNSTQSHQGLFGYARGSNFQNIAIIDANINGQGYVGILAGSATSGGRLIRYISNCYCTGIVNGQGDDVGGLVGYAATKIENSYSFANVTNNGNYTGGLAGDGGTIINSFSDCTVTSTGSYVGGIAGQSSQITNSFSHGSIKGDGDDIGGLAGYISDSVMDSYFSGSVVGYGDYVGGLVGHAKKEVEGSYSIGSVTGHGDYVGGLVGYGDTCCCINSCFSSSEVSCSGEYAGGLAGYVQSDGVSGFICISNSYATGDVIGKNYVGGLAGHTWFKNENCYATGNVSGTSFVGGLVGVVYSDIVSTSVNIMSSGSVSGTEAVGSLYGGLCHLFDGQELEGFTITSAKCRAQAGVNIIGAGAACDSAIMEFSLDNSYDVSPYTSGVVAVDPTITLQVGISGDNSAKISFETNMSINLASILNNGAQSNKSYDVINNFMNMLSAKSTELGSISNRLESSLESLSVDIENTTSSLSTIKDADVAKVSSEYIKHQILQQASATLLATANQSPTIALRLLGAL